MIEDLDVAHLAGYLPKRDEPDDFDKFWAASLHRARVAASEPRFAPIQTWLKTVDSFDVTFSGYAGQPIKGWLNVPHHRPEHLPCVVEYLGYGGGRGSAQDWLLFSAAGYAHFVVDTRGQGGGWRNGDTPDIAERNTSHHPGFTTLGIATPEDYYFHRLYVDAALAVDAARACPLVDADRVAVAGTSQGGGTAIASAGLSKGLAAVLPGVPFMCHIARALKITDTMPYFEITRYLRANPRAKSAVMRTLSYVDGVNFATRAHAPALFSVALMDQICPPSTVFAAFNHYAGPKDIRVWEFNDHDGAVPQHAIEQLEFLATVL